MTDLLQMLKYTDEAGLLPQVLILSVYRETKLMFKSAEIWLQDGLQEWRCHTMLKPLLIGTSLMGWANTQWYQEGVIHSLQ